MSKRKHTQRELAEKRWPLLSNLMACFFNQDLDILYGSVEGAITAASRNGSVAHRRAILKEWRDWNACAGAADDIRPSLDEFFVIDIYFKRAIDARILMNKLYDCLIEQVGVETLPPAKY